MQDKKDPPSALLEENLKKAVTEMLILHLLTEKESYIGELTETLKRRSGGVLNVVFPYAAIYRLQQSDYITETKKRQAPDGRRRQYYSVTDSGKAYLTQLLYGYRLISGGIAAILDKEVHFDE